MHVHRYDHARAQIGHARARIGHARVQICHARARIGHARAQIIVHSLTQITHACALIGHTWIDRAQLVIHPYACRTQELSALHDIHGFAVHMYIHCISGIHINQLVFCLKDKNEKLHLFFNTRLWAMGCPNSPKIFHILVLS